MTLDEMTNRITEAQPRPTSEMVWQFITPAVVVAMLAGQVNIRSVNMNTVKRYAADMIAGQWLESGEPWKVAASGELLDGFHRAHAITEAGVGVWMPVVYGVPSEAVVAMDTGTPRPFALTLKNNGHDDPSGMGSMARIGWLLERDIYPVHTPAPSPQQKLAWLDAHPDAAIVYSQARKMARVLGAPKAPTAALFAVAQDRGYLSLAQIEDFVNEAIDEAILDPNSGPSRLQITMNRLPRTRRMETSHYVAVLTKAVKAYAHGSEIRVLKYSAKGKKADDRGEEYPRLVKRP